MGDAITYFRKYVNFNQVYERGKIADIRKNLCKGTEVW